MSTQMQMDASLNQSNIDDDVIDLRDYWRIIDQFKWPIIGLTGLVGLIALLIVFALHH